MNIEINPDFEKSTTLRALSAFLTLLADEQDGSTKDAAILSAIVQKGLHNPVDRDDLVVGITMAAVRAENAQLPKTATEVMAQRVEAAQAQEQAEQAILQAQEGAALKEVTLFEQKQIQDITGITYTPPKRTRRTKAEMAADAGNGAPAAAEKAAPATDSVTAESTIDDVRAALQRYTAVHGMPDGIALLKNYGAGRISELGLEQYPLFIAECDAVEAA